MMNKAIVLHGVVFLVVLGTASCERPTFNPTIRYVLEADTQVAAAAQPTTLVFSEMRVGVRPLEAAQPYRALMAYVGPGQRMQYYTNAEWADQPRSIVTQALVDAMLYAELFSDVGYAFDMGVPDLVLYGRLRAFQEDRTVSPPVALCEVRLELRYALRRLPVWAETIQASAPLQGEGPDALAVAMGIAVRDVLAQAIAGMAAAELPPENDETVSPSRRPFRPQDMAPSMEEQDLIGSTL